MITKINNYDKYFLKTDDSLKKFRKTNNIINQTKKL